MFANYFSYRVEGVPRPATRLFVEGRTHPVLEFFLDDIRHVGTVSVVCVGVWCVWGCGVCGCGFGAYVWGVCFCCEHYKHNLKSHILLLLFPQCKPMDPDNPRVTEEAMNMALRLILSFDDLASDDPR